MDWSDCQDVGVGSEGAPGLGLELEGNTQELACKPARAWWGGCSLDVSPGQSTLAAVSRYSLASISLPPGDGGSREGKV